MVLTGLHTNNARGFCTNPPLISYGGASETSRQLPRRGLRWTSKEVKGGLVQNPRALFGVSDPVRTMRYLITGWLLGLASCVRTAPEPLAREWISSDSSLYSPTAHLRVGSHVEAGAVTISIDSGRITIPGEPVADAPVLMSHLYLTAILATLDSSELAVSRSGSGRRPMERRGWRPVAMSDSVLVVAEIRYGETISLASRSVHPAAGRFHCHTAVAGLPPDW